MKIDTVEAAPLSVGKFVVKDVVVEAGEPKEIEKKYVLVLDFISLTLAKEKIGLDFMKRENWKDLEGGSLRTLCWCAFQRFHSEVTEEQVLRMISLFDESNIWLMLIELVFPGTKELVASEVKRLKQEADGNSVGESAPVPVSAR